MVVDRRCDSAHLTAVAGAARAACLEWSPDLTWLLHYGEREIVVRTSRLDLLAIRVGFLMRRVACSVCPAGLERRFHR